MSNQEHDTTDGPCACGAWHGKPPYRYLTSEVPDTEEDRQRVLDWNKPGQTDYRYSIEDLAAAARDAGPLNGALDRAVERARTIAACECLVCAELREGRARLVACEPPRTDEAETPDSPERVGYSPPHSTR